MTWSSKFGQRNYNFVNKYLPRRAPSAGDMKFATHINLDFNTSIFFIISVTFNMRTTYPPDYNGTRRTTKKNNGANLKLLNDPQATTQLSGIFALEI